MKKTVAALITLAMITATPVSAEVVSFEYCVGMINSQSRFMIEDGWEIFDEVHTDTFSRIMLYWKDLIVSLECDMSNPEIFSERHIDG